MKSTLKSKLAVLLCLNFSLTGCMNRTDSVIYVSTTSEDTVRYSLDDTLHIPAYSGEPWTAVNENIPVFDTEQLPLQSEAVYGETDDLGRCTAAYACLGKDLMPEEERGSISQVQPTGWQTVRYDDLIEDGYLYNRCHLIAYALAGENDNERNLITGTRYMNVEGMLPWEIKVADYIRSTGNHVLYLAEPVFLNDNLTASGVHLMAYSAEDNGEGISFNIYCYNVQPGIVIDYETGASHREDVSEDEIHLYILNTNTKKFHLPDCDSVTEMKEKNKQEYEGTRESVMDMGYIPCHVCNP